LCSGRDCEERAYLGVEERGILQVALVAEAWKYDEFRFRDSSVQVTRNTQGRSLVRVAVDE
jgi:hypothetical protein